MREVGHLLEQRHGGQREHEQGQAAGAQQHQARGEPDGRRHHRRDDQARDRLVPPPMLGQHAHRIGPGSEERGVPERHDSGIPEHEVEGERKQDRDQELGAESEMLREGEVQRDRDHDESV